ncbi:MAG: hypothetical protein Q8N88_01695, partial [Nanoarchaeota archaeon]|nr:hypothetical protein [Nanoarchaeota archaeon]
MITLHFQNKFSGKELVDIILGCAKESNLNIDLDNQIKKEESKIRHIHLSKQLNNQVGFYDKLRKFLNNKISCCIYLEEDRD